MYSMPRLVPKLTENLKYDRTIQMGDIFRHFKGGVYQVVGLGTHTETGEKMVVYQPLMPAEDGQKPLWVRPMEMFLSKTDHDKYPDVEQPYRLVKMTIEKG